MCWRCDLEHLSIETDPGSSKGLYLRERFVFVSCNDLFIVLGEVLVLVCLGFFPAKREQSCESHWVQVASGG